VGLGCDVYFFLCTFLWGKLWVIVLFTIFTDWVLGGVGAFLFSTVGITFFGEIMPQAYFSRNALLAGSVLSPILRVYRVLLFPVAKPCAVLLDRWIGPEGRNFFREEEIELILDSHIREPSTDISYAEGRGALNFLRLDDLKIASEGRPLEVGTVLRLPMREGGECYLPEAGSREAEELAMRMGATELKWMVLVDGEGWPKYGLNADDYLRARFTRPGSVGMAEFCQVPVVVTDATRSLDEVLPKLDVEADGHEDRVLDREVVLYWGERTKRIITGVDILGRLLHGIVERKPEGER
ncbi:MAG: DUF21 domain-containing protein, partial [Verrucomicrobiota bacterium]